MDLTHFQEKIFLVYYLMNLKYIIMLIFVIFMKEEKKKIHNSYLMGNYFINE